MSKFISNKKTKAWKSTLSMCIFLLSFCTATVFAQGITIRGTVTEGGEPFPGVTVMVSGTSIGTATDANGSYSINVPNADAVLIFSFVGYNTVEMSVGTQREINVEMSEGAQEIAELVVVGYGVQRRETLTGSVATINADELMTTKTENVVSNMQGKAPGLMIRQQTGEPGDFSNLISIRGFGSPVVVIDGIVRNRDGIADLAQLNPDDIETISILKDASAAIYGMNAANGVIIVTTKKGEEGKARFTYSGMLGFKMPTGMPDMMNAYEYRLFENEFQRNAGAAPAYTIGELGQYREGARGYEDFDWIDMYMYNVVPVNNHTFSVRGGSERLRYFTSFSYVDDKGLLTSDIYNYNRFTFRNNLTAELTDNLSMNLLISGRLDNRSQGLEPFIWTYKSLIVNDRGVGPYVLDDPTRYSQVGPENKNPAALIDPDGEGYRKMRNLNMQSSIDFTYTNPLLPGLSINALGSYDIRNGNESQLERAHDIYSYRTNVYALTRGIDRYWNRIDLYSNTYGRLMATYSFAYEDHSVTLMGAVEASEQRIEFVRGDRNYPDIFTFDIINQGASTTATNQGSREFRRYAAYLGRLNYEYKSKYLLEFVLRRDGSYRYAPVNRWVWFPSVSAGWRVSEEDFFKNNIEFINSLRLRVSYGESGRDQGTAYAFLPAYSSSASRGFIYNTNELTIGMVPPGVVNDRMTWVAAKFYNAAIDIDVMRGKLGATFEYFERRNTGILAARFAATPNTFGAGLPDENLNSDLTHGLELSIRYRDRVGSNFRYNVDANVTFTRTKRLHVERGPFSSEWDKWRNGNQNRYTGRSLIYQHDGQYASLAEYETAPLVHVGTTDGVDMWINGNSRMLPGSYRIIDTNGDGRINGDDQVYQNWAYGDQGYVSGSGGSQRVNPPLQYGFSFGATYKAFDFNMLLQGAALYRINYHMNDIWGYGRYPTLHNQFRDRWRPVNPNPADMDVLNPNFVWLDPFDPATEWIPGKFPAGRPYRYFYTNEESATTNVWRPNAAYLRLKNIEVGYTLPRAVLERIRIDRLRVFVNGTNLLTICHKDARLVDPERHENEWNAGLSYPIMKAVNFGLNLTF